MSYVDAVLSDNPVAFWPLQDASGDLVDVSGNGLDLTSHTGIDYQFAAGPLAGSSSVRIQGGEFAGRSSVSAAINNITMELWFYRIDVLGDTQDIFINRGTTDGYALHINSNGKLQGSVTNVAFLSESTATIPDEAWTHIVMVRDAGTWKYYINGELDTANAGTGTPTAPTTNTRLNGSSQMTALYAYAAFYDTALSLAQIQGHYNEIYTGLSYSDQVLLDNPLVYYRLDGTTGRTVDSSGNGLTLTEVPQSNGFFDQPGLIYNDSNGAQRFNAGAGDGYLMLPNASAGSIMFDGEDPFTVECWCMPLEEPSADYNRILSWSNESTAGTNGYGIVYQQSVGWLFFRRAAGSDNSTALDGAANAPRMNQKDHIVAYFDPVADEIGIYVNGILKDTTVDTFVQGSYTGDLYVGRGQFGGTSGFHTMDEVAIYAGRLPESRILAHFEAGQSKKQTAFYSRRRSSR